MLWDWKKLVEASGGCADGDAPSGVNGVSIDTRTIERGDLFVALKDMRDGHDFVTGAFEAGAAAALVSRNYARKPGDGALIRADEPLRALESIGRAARARMHGKVIAVTGSAGKTGTKEMLRACLSACGKVHASEKSYNNHWGVPLTLARMPADTEFGVFEIGMNHAGEITLLSRMVRPHIAIITNVLPVHVGHFPDGEVGIANAKAEIFAGLEPGGVAIVLRDSPHYERLRSAIPASATVRAFRKVDASMPSAGLGLREGECGYTPRGKRSLGDTSISVNRIQFTMASPRVTGNGHFDLEIQLAGEHIAANLAAVLLALDSIGITLDAEIAGALATLRPLAGRGATLRLTPLPDRPPLMLIDESYNANPASMHAAIVTAAQMRQRESWQRLVLVLGDMLELGEGSVEFHRQVATRTAALPIDKVFACGADMQAMFDALPTSRRGEWRPASADLVPLVLAAIRPGDVVMVKGSLGSKMGPIVEAIKSHFGPAS